MREMADRDLSLLLDRGQKGPLVVHFEREDAVLVRRCECRGVDGAVVGGVGGVEGDAVKGR